MRQRSGRPYRGSWARDKRAGTRPGRPIGKGGRAPRQQPGGPDRAARGVPACACISGICVRVLGGRAMRRRRKKVREKERGIRNNHNNNGDEGEGEDGGSGKEGKREGAADVSG